MFSKASTSFNWAVCTRFTLAAFEDGCAAQTGALRADLKFRGGSIVANSPKVVRWRARMTVRHIEVSFRVVL